MVWYLVVQLASLISQCLEWFPLIKLGFYLMHLSFFPRFLRIYGTLFGTFIWSILYRLCLVVSLRHQNRVVLSWDDIVILSLGSMCLAFYFAIIVAYGRL